MNKKLLTIFSLLLIFFAMSCNKKPTDPTAPLKDSQYVGKWYEENNPNPIFEIKQDGGIDGIDNGVVIASVNGTDVVKEGDATFKATFSLVDGQSQEIVFVFTSSTTGTVTASGQEGSTAPIVKK
ncbi:hypothetical protein [Brachyspira pilosicoli]|uniref:hypothetical protein n=1 Tax=Brachyspira pilosicoli TaxID=52584 RepID=UPI0024302E72|nr:hypothetical protein [Brachyspira pilosicoli]